MRTVSFQNVGLIDPRSIKTFGVNEKETDDPIGFFGTGLKYAIAILLRNGHAITIYSGLDAYTFGISSTVIRGTKEHQIITMNGEELGFTTDLGKTWEMWKAFRELHCNSMDEDGVTREGKMDPVAGKTTIHVEGLEFHQCLARIDEIVLPDRDVPVDVSSTLAAYEGTNNKVYYRRINVGEMERRSIFTYNIVSPIELTEDRTAKYSFEYLSRIRQHILYSDNLDFLRRVLTAPEHSLEHELNYSGRSPGKAFLEVIGALRNDRSVVLNKTALALYFRHAPEAAANIITLDTFEQTQMDTALNFCRSLGYNIEEYPIVMMDSLGPGIDAQVKDGKIIISKTCFTKGTKYLASTLIEEFVHLRHGHGDCTRELQTYLFDTIVTMGERHILKRPL